MSGTEIDWRGRQTGKTTDLIEWMDDAPEGTTRVFIAAHGHDAAMRALKMARDREQNKLESWQFISLNELKTYNPFPYMTGQTRLEYGLDEAIEALCRLLPLKGPLGRVTIS
jgi:hypothetical protein